MPARPPGRMSLGTLLLGSGPRFARDALGPVLAFYALWKLWGLLPGIAAATLVAVGAFWWQRRQANSGIMPAVGLGIALIQAVVGLASGSASAFFAPGLVANALYGCAFLGSAAIGRPLAGVFAGEMYAFPQRVRTSALFRRIFSVVSLAWGSYMVVRAVVRLAVLSWSSVDLFVVVSILTGIPFTLALMTWSFWYPLRAFQRQPELWSPRSRPARHERRPRLVFRRSSSLIGRFNEESTLWCYGRTLALFQREGDSAAQRDALRTVPEAGESHPSRLGRCLPRMAVYVAYAP